MMAQAAEQQQELGLGDIEVPVETLPKLQQLDLSADKGDATAAMAALYEAIKDCTNCRLHEGRNKFVFGDGNPNAEVIFVGEGPGRDEDLQGKPFVGRAGQLLDKILAAIGFNRTQVYIGNIIKCRPPGNRDPQADEMAACMPYLKKQIELMNPAFICCLGRVAAQALLNTTTPLGKLRGRFHDLEGRKVLVTYHPAALLRFPQYKHDTWEDVKLLRYEYDKLFAK
ncbi:MAG: uracil-DNA glycosylase [candidate division Zixibacteria bacterium]|nr:uracil-DNA glycosylase [candidate division Zixibacteria bacterium]